jgi:hypothetical protein
LSACVLNQFSSHWLLFDALQSTITMCLKCKELVTNPLAQVNLIDDDFWITFELSLFVTNIKREIWGVLESFLFFNEYIYIYIYIYISLMQHATFDARPHIKKNFV